MKAYITFKDDHNGIKDVQLNDHKFGLGINQNNLCISHQSFECWDSLSDEELDAINIAEEVK